VNIKYRAYFPNQKHFLYFSLYDAITKSIEEPWRTALVTFPESEIDRYVGFIGGKDLYENDIVEAADTGVSYGKCLISYYGGGFVLMGIIGDQKVVVGDLPPDWECNILGNVHENKDILE